MKQVILAGMVGLALVGCNSGSSDSNTSAAKFNLAFSDAPVDSLKKVCVAFDQISVKQTDEDESSWGTASFAADQSSAECIPDTYSIPVDADGNPLFMVINLMAFQGEKSLQVLSDEALEAGTYTQIRLNAVASGDYGDPVNTPYSHVVTDSDQVMELGYTNANGKIIIPDSFEISASTAPKYTLEFDLRKGIVENKAHGYRLKTTAIRMVNNESVATISGSVGASSCSNDISDAHVYVYTTPNDGNYGDIQEDSPNAPYATTAVDASTGSFEVGYVPLGTYDIALVCNGSVDHPEEDNSAVLNIDTGSIHKDAVLTTENLTVTF
ncbi:DUF4382 domain-containing protein [Photobacterium sp. J15]|uniref:DUF4382 domain-containing protein n=1 Tax=Photobacterium sp. J15 TaxID=265901 RepID=UPI0007E4D338|nr:DUF4382 domain-containing protein [Photobacterium sp. J15]